MAPFLFAWATRGRYGAHMDERGQVSPSVLDVRFFAPPDDLGPCFTTFYRLEVNLAPDAFLEDLLQPEWGNLRFFAGDPPEAQSGLGEKVEGKRFLATGPSAHPTRFRLRRTRMWGIGLLPLGWARFVDRKASEHVELVADGDRHESFARFQPLADILCDPEGTDDNQFTQIIAFFRKLAPPHADENRILSIHHTMIDPHLQLITDFARRAGMTKRTLERLCLKHFGFSPQVLLRRQRVMRSLAAYMLEPGKNWSETIDRLYHDQSHFVRAFQDFMGMTPSEYARMPHPVLSAFMEERQRVWGSPVQTLDVPAGQTKGRG